MGIRDIINRNPIGVSGLLIIAILAAIALTWWQLHGMTPSKPGAFFTIDDGKSYFGDDPKRVTPFEYKGKQAVRAHVFRGPDGKEFVGYLERSTPQAAEIIRKVHNRKADDPMPTPQEMGMAQTGREFKKPGAKDWIPMNQRDEILKITTVTAPDGSPATEVE